MMKKSMCALSVVLLVVAFVGCPIANQFLKTRLQGTWEYVDPADPDSKITLEFDGDKVTMTSPLFTSQVTLTNTGTFEVLESGAIQENGSIQVAWDDEDDFEVWYIEFFGGKRKLAVTPETGTLGDLLLRGLPPIVFTRVSF